MRAFAREPLVYFVALTGLLFGVSAFSTAGARPDTLVVTKDRIASLAATFAKTSQRPPSDAELQKLIDEYVRDEVSVREATALGLDKDDTVIRRRLRQKLEEIVGGTQASRRAAIDVYYHALLAHYTIVRSTKKE